MDSLWLVHGRSVGSSHWSMGSPLTVHGGSTVSPWWEHGPSMVVHDASLVVHGLSMMCLWAVRHSSMMDRWWVGSASTDNARGPHGGSIDGP